LLTEEADLAEEVEKGRRFRRGMKGKE